MTHKKMWLIAPVLYLVSLAAYGGEALVDGLHLKPASAVVKVGGTVKLSLDNCVVVDKALGKKPKAKSDSKPKKKYYGEGVADDELAPLPDWKLVCEGDDGYDVLAPLVLTNVKWKVVDGQGRVSGDLKGATYHAPASKPTPNQATVSATVTYNVGKSKTILLSRITILPAKRKYQGNLRQVRASPGQNISLAGDITWTETEGSQGTFVPTGRVSATITAEGCGNYTGSVAVSGGSLDLDVPAYRQDSFRVGFARLMLSCNGQSTPYVFLDSIAPACGEAAPSIIDPLKLTGSSTCAGRELNWDFSRL